MRARRTDTTHKPILDAIRTVLGWPCMSLHTQGDGCEDILVAVPAFSVLHSSGIYLCSTHIKAWVMLEAKTIERESTGYYRHTKAQKEWYAKTAGFPRVVATGPQDAIDKLRKLQRP